MPAEHLLRLLSINPQTLLNSQALLCLLSSLVSYVELRLTEIQLVVAMVSQRFCLQLVPEHPVERNPLLTLQTRHGILMTLEQRDRLNNTKQLDTQQSLSTYELAI